MPGAEFAVLDWIQANLRCGFLDSLMVAVSTICNHGEVWIILAAVLLIFRKTRRLGAAVAVALVLDLVLCNLILKPLVDRIRPCDINQIALLVPRPPDASFPSGHTAVSFAAVGALAASRSRLWIPSCVLAAVIAFSRLYLYVHWPTDVLGGIVVGLVCGVAGWAIVAGIQRAWLKRKRSGSG